MVVLLSLSAIIIAFIPGLIWLFLFLKEDKHPEPKSLITKAFGLGAIVTIPVLIIQVSFKYLSGASYSEVAVFSIVILAIIEEVLKFYTGYFFIRKKRDFDEPIDAMIYLIAVGLGFATVENILIIFPIIFSSATTAIFSVGETILLRFVGATLLHTLTGALAGYYWVRGIIRHSQWKFIALGLFLVSVIHFIFNYLMSQFEIINLIYPTIFLLGVSFFVLEDFEKVKETPLS